MEEKLLVPITGRIRRLDPHDVAARNSLESCILETQQIAWGESKHEEELHARTKTGVITDRHRLTHLALGKGSRQSSS